MATSAAILPDSKSLIIPFRAVNLYAVDLSVIRIFENNVLMFMQNNSLSSANELRRSGRLVYKKTLWLAKDSSKDVHRWEDYSIDLAGLIHREPFTVSSSRSARNTPLILAGEVKTRKCSSRTTSLPTT